jgi:chromate transporter
MTRTPALVEVAARFARLGLTSFGGPIAHVGYFRREFVERARWLDDATFAEMLALCSVLPGPTSSQIGILIGTLRAGPAGGFLAWLAFTAPSAFALGALGVALRAARLHGSAWERSALFTGTLEGLTGVAAAVVTLAVVSLFARLARTARLRWIVAGSIALALPADLYAPSFAWVALAAGGAAGAFVLGPGDVAALPPAAHIPAPPRAGTIAAAGAFALAIVALPLVAIPGSALDSFATFFRAGALVFGGAHVVLPLLRSIVGSDGVPANEFFAGYAAAQAVPGPLFSFAAFLGAADRGHPGGWPGAALAVTAIFAPSFLLLAMVAPLWRELRSLPRSAATLAGLNAAVVGLLAAVLCGTLLPAVERAPIALLCGAGALLTLGRYNWPPWVVVALGAGFGAALARAAGAAGAP